MTIESSIEHRDLALDRQFFQALVRGDLAALGRLLSDDFTLADLSGALLAKADFLALIKSGDLKFVSILPEEARARSYGDTTIINGRTIMKMEFKGTELTIQSRYTHVVAAKNGDRVLVAAQGTPIQGSPNPP